MAAGLQHIANSQNPPVHHIRRGDNITSGISKGTRLFNQNFNAGIVQNFALIAQHAIMAMVGIGIESNITYNADIRTGCFNRSYRLADQIFIINRFSAIGCFQAVGCFGKKRNSRNAQLMRLFGLYYNLIN